ncbi:MAG: HAMP domain-containing sensor histidine kinase [Myxococcota bacterium]
MCLFVVVGLTSFIIWFSNTLRLSDLTTMVGPDEQARCLEDPTRFSLYEPMFHLWAYDASGHPHNPDAPSLPADVFVEVPKENARQWQLSEGPWWRRAAIQRIRDDGPCAILYADPPPRFAGLPWLRRSTLVITLLGLTGALMATIVLAVRPLVERLSRLDESARGVGSDTFVSAHDPGDDEIGRISWTLDEAHHRIVTDRAERVRRHRALEHHLATVAHDLRTPLASLQLMLEDLGAQHLGAASTTVREARLEVAYLEALADNLHQATRMTGGLSAKGGEVNLTEVVRRVEARFAILGRLLGGTVAAALPDEPVWARCRPALAERALANLVHNGIIHGTGDVGMVLDATADGFRITVASAGEPMPEAVVRNLARRRLERDTDPSRTRGPNPRLTGKGLGIAIVNAVAKSAEFTITFEGPPTGGLTVTLSGPRLTNPSENGH